MLYFIDVTVCITAETESEAIEAVRQVIDTGDMGAGLTFIEADVTGSEEE
jgi:hypothetical protein